MMHSTMPPSAEIGSGPPDSATRSPQPVLPTADLSCTCMGAQTKYWGMIPSPPVPPISCHGPVSVPETWSARLEPAAGRRPARAGLKKEAFATLKERLESKVNDVAGMLPTSMVTFTLPDAKEMVPPVGIPKL